MAKTLTVNLTGVLRPTFSDDAQTVLNAVTQGDISFSDELTNGTGADQADLIYQARRTLNNTSENLDLAGGVTDASGATITFARVKALFIRNRSTTAGENVTVGGAASNAAVLFGATGDTVVIPPNGFLLLWFPTTGRPITAGTADILKMLTNANISYDIVIVGASA